MTETSRRQFLAYSAALLVAPFAAEAQAPAAPKPARVGVLLPSADSRAFHSYFEGFRRKMTELGYADGRNLTLLHHFGDDEKARLVTAAARLRDLHPDVIVAIAPAAVEAASGTMQSIPIIAVDHGTDPCGRLREDIDAAGRQPAHDVHGVAVLGGQAGGAREGLPAPASRSR